MVRIIISLMSRCGTSYEKGTYLVKSGHLHTKVEEMAINRLKNIGLFVKLYEEISSKVKMI